MQDVNFDEKSELAKTIAGALGRRSDQIVIDEMTATAVGSTIPAGATGTSADGLTMAKVVEAQTKLRAKGVDNRDLFALINADGLKGLLDDEKATNADYQTVKALVSGDINSLCGFRFITMENREGREGGLEIAGNTVDSYFFQRDSVGIAVGIDIRTSVDWIADRTSWLCNGMLKAGAAVRDPEGICKVQYKDNV
jgi:hypothetical protein